MPKAQTAALEWLLGYNKITPQQCTSPQLVAVIEGLHRYEVSPINKNRIHQDDDRRLWQIEYTCIKELVSRPDAPLDSILACFRQLADAVDGDEEHPLGEINNFLREDALPPRLAQVEPDKLISLFELFTHQEIRAAILYEFQRRDGGLSFINRLWERMDSLSVQDNDTAYFAGICSEAPHSCPEEWLELYWHIHQRQGVTFGENSLTIDKISWSDLARIAGVELAE